MPHVLEVKSIVGNGSRLTACCTCGWKDWSPRTHQEAENLHAAHVAEKARGPIDDPDRWRDLFRKGEG